jgi:hypothetical protein
MDEEKKFMHNLTRLAGPINAVTVDSMFETLSYINSNAVLEAEFIEGTYLGSIFDDEEFLQQSGIRICSVQILFSRYEEAKRNSDDVFLSLLRQKHRIARAFLDSDDVRRQIRELIEVRKGTMQHRAIWTTITNILGLLQHFPNCGIGRLLAPMLPQLLQTVQQLESGENTNHDISRPSNDV